MRKILIAIILPLIALVAACSKEDKPAMLPAGSIAFTRAADKDTIEMPISILKDSLMVLRLNAAITGGAAKSNHWISFAVDSTKINAYRAKYGAAALNLPTTSYIFFKSMTQLRAGETLSDSAELNIGQQTKLIEYSTYVLPVVIKSVDGNPDGIATSRVLYFVFKTGKPAVINKTGWTIAGFSSQNGTSAPANLLDADNLTTFWASLITQTMPQWVSINFNKEVTFTAVNYYVPTALRYPTLGGYPTTFRIETSMNGTTWTDKGVFNGNIVNNMQSVDLGVTTARYLRFTALSCVKYSNAYEAVFISGIGLVP